MREEFPVPLNAQMPPAVVARGGGRFVEDRVGGGRSYQVLLDRAVEHAEEGFVRRHYRDVAAVLFDVVGQLGVPAAASWMFCSFWRVPEGMPPLRTGRDEDDATGAAPAAVRGVQVAASPDNTPVGDVLRGLVCTRRDNGPRN